MANRDNSDKYNLYYPQHLDWNRKIWVLKVGDCLRREEKDYRIKEILKTYIKGSKPQIVLEELKNAET